MKKVINCEVENCIPTPSSCTEWNGGEIEYLGICNGDSLNNLLWEVITKLKEIAGEDLSAFDIDSLLDICNQKAPSEITLLSILNLLKANQICLKDFIDTLNDKLNELLSEEGVSDQTQIDNIDINPSVNEPEFALTCTDVPALSHISAPTSTQVQNLAADLCDLETELGSAQEVADAIVNTPANMNAEFGLLPGWIISPENLAQNYNNLLIAFGNVWARVKSIEDTCCAPACSDVKLGFTAIYNEDNTGIILKFTAGAGTEIPSGFLDIGSIITVTDIDGNVETFTTSNPDLIANNAQIEISITGLNLNGDLTVSIDANMSNGSLTCSKCLGKVVKKAQCDYCEVCATGAEGSTVVIVYTSSSSSLVVDNSTTTTSTTTTTTAAP